MVMVVTYEFVIHGKVQHVGFREKIENIGKILNINGVIYNHKDGTVRILANFDSERKKNLFKELIRELEEVDKLIKIDKIEERELKTYIDFPEGINRLSSDDLLELNKELDEGVRYIKLIFGELEEHGKLLMKIDEKLDAHTNLLIEIRDSLREIKNILKEKH